MDGSNVGHASCLDEVIREIVMMQSKTCVTDVQCDCGLIHRIPLDGYRICQCGQKVVSPIFDHITE